TGAEVALKLLRSQDDRDARRFSREARLLSEIHHPGVVRYIDHGQTTEGRLYLAMEWLEGHDLAWKMQRQGLRGEGSIALARGVAEALEVVHARGVIHRDIKPQNLFLPDGRIDRIKVLDFGIARVRHLPPLSTHSQSMVGTLGYIAPEQVRNAR